MQQQSNGILKNKMMITGIQSVYHRHPRFWYWIIYTVLFAVLSLGIFYSFIYNQKSLVWALDGISQHFNALVYYRGWLRELFGNLLIRHRLQVPLWNMHLGYGADVITTLHYYVIGDPLNLFAALVPRKEMMEGFYSGMVILRIYLAGLAFSAFCFYRHSRGSGTLIGTFIYIFSTWTILGMRHPFFLNPLIYFPLVLLGAEKGIREKKMRLYILMLAVSAVSSFYFAYMICIFTAVYILFRYFMIFRGFQWRSFFAWAAKYAGGMAIGLMMASVIFLPVTMFMLTTGRAQTSIAVQAFYPLKYYWHFLPSFLIGQTQTGYWTYMGYTALGMTGVILLFLNRHKNTALKIGFVMMTVFLLLPFFGHVFNGFSYATNRFVWVYGFLVAFVFVRTYPDIAHLRKKQRGVLILAVTAIALFCLSNRNSRTEMFLSAIVLLCLSAGWIILSGSRLMKGKGKWLFHLSMVGMLGISLILQSGYLYSITEHDFSEEFTDAGMALPEMTEESPYEMVSRQKNGEFARYDQYNTEYYYAPAKEGVRNTALQQDDYAASTYWSLLDQNVSRFFREQYLNMRLDYEVRNLDNRYALEMLSSVRYYLTKSGQERYVPYGYDHLIEEEEDDGDDTTQENALYENPDALPLAYTYSSYIPRKTYESLWVTKKQQSLLEGCVLDHSSFPKTKLRFDDRKITPEITTPEDDAREQDPTAVLEDGVEVKDHKIIVTKKNAHIALNFQGLPESENCLVIEGLNFQGMSPLQCARSDGSYDRLSAYDQNTLKEKSRYWEADTEVNIDVYGNYVHKTLTYDTEKNNFYTDIHDYLLNMGYNKPGSRRFVLTFPSTGVYTYRQLSIVSQPTEQMRRYAAGLKQDTLQNVRITDNRVRGTIDLDRPKILCFSIPYSRGWTAVVDGRRRELKQANTMYMALELPAGKHSVSLTYCTPYLKTGAMVSVAGIALFLLTICAEHVRIKRKHKKGKEIDG